MPYHCLISTITFFWLLPDYQIGMCPGLGLNLHISGITRDVRVFTLINSVYSCFRGLIAYLGSLLILYYEITFSNFEVLNFYLVKVCRTFSICSSYTQVEVTVPLPFLLVAFMICFYINSLIYLEFSVWRELGPGFLVFWTAEHFLSSICPVVHLGPLIKVLFWIHFQFLLYFSCSFNSVQPDPSLSVSLECRHWPFIESIHVFSNFIHTMQTETTGFFVIVNPFINILMPHVLEDSFPPGF